MGERPIVFFDGACGLCNATLDLLLRADRRQRLLFAPLQGDTAQRLLGTSSATPLDTIVLLDAEGRHEKSAAVLQICRHLGGLWRLWLLSGIVPQALRNAAYSFVARHRYAWFGRKDTCRQPTASERARFLP